MDELTKFAIDVPIVQLSGADDWALAYRVGEIIETRFPGQDAWEFAVAMVYNGPAPAVWVGASLVDFVMLREGEHDGGPWLWALTFDLCGRWLVEAGCDFTGWDCQSWADFTREDDPDRNGGLGGVVPVGSPRP